MGTLVVASGAFFLGARHAATPGMPAALAPMARSLERPVSPPSRPASMPPRDPAADSLLGDIWIHPLPGPARRMPIRDSRLFGAGRDGDRPHECRAGHCGVDIGGERLGEPVLASHDGVIERVRRDPNPLHGGHYVRIAHRGGTVFTQYFHLGVIPATLHPGVPVKAGDVIGYVGNTGIVESAPHLHFTISVRAPRARAERYLDPEPLIALWPLRVLGAKDTRATITAEVDVGEARGFDTRRSRRNQHSRVRGHTRTPADDPNE
jgi:murein DD-endopeptidase MepM/ murein hydrolase activator NlpD